MKGSDFLSYALEVSNFIMNYPTLNLLDSRKIYNDKFSYMGEEVFYKIISRLCGSKKIIRLSKGIYCVPKETKFGMMISNETDILNYYLGSRKNKGVIVGYRLYNKYKITTQMSKNIEIFSNVLYENSKKVANVTIKKIDTGLNDYDIKLIELLDIIENYKSIENINYRTFIETIKYLSKFYNEKSLKKIIKNIKIKKGTLASLKVILDYYNIDNSVDLYLKKTSKYHLIDLEGIYELIN